MFRFETETSIYEVRDIFSEREYPGAGEDLVIQKIEIKPGKKSGVPVGRKYFGTNINITGDGLKFFSATGECILETSPLELGRPKHIIDIHTQ
jgi:hypothetical protein